MPSNRYFDSLRAAGNYDADAADRARAEARSVTKTIKGVTFTFDPEGPATDLSDAVLYATSDAHPDWDEEATLDLAEQITDRVISNGWLA